MNLTNCNNILTTTENQHQKFTKQNICITVQPEDHKLPPEKEELTTNVLRKKLQEIYKDHWSRVINSDQIVMEKKLNKISESVFNPPEQVLELFIRSVSQKNSQALNLSNLPVFWELANAYEYSWLMDDCKKFMINPTNEPEIRLHEWLKDCK